MKREKNLHPDHIIDPWAQMPADGVISMEMSGLVDQALNRLNPRQTRIIRAYFNIGAERMTLEQLGQEFGITREAVRQTRDKALEKMSYTPGIRDFKG